MKIELTKDKKMNCYEHTLIIRQDTSEKQQEEVIKKYEDIINKNSGKLIKTEKWGSIIFSNPLKKNKKGFYVHFKFESAGDTIKKLEDLERIDNQLLRFLTVKVKSFDLEKNYFEQK